MLNYAERYRRAKAKLLKRHWLSRKIEYLYQWGTDLIYGPDGFKKHGFTHLFAELFFIDCPVCLFWRGLSVGFAFTALISLVFVAIFCL